MIDGGGTVGAADTMCVIDVSYALDGNAGVRTLRLQMAAAIAEHRYDIILDLASCSFISHQAIGLVIERARQCQALGGDVLLCGLTEYHKRMLRMAGVLRLLRSFETRDLAIQSAIARGRIRSLRKALGAPTDTAAGQR